jgi:hypothetical protein
MNSIKLPRHAVFELCVGGGFPRLRPEIKAELDADGYDSTILFMDGGFIHIQFQSSEQAVMFRLKYSELLVG